MTFWFFPHALTQATEEQAFIHQELIISAEGLPDLAKSQARDQIAVWLRTLHPALPPEQITLKTEHYWSLAHEVLPGDYAILADAPGSALMVGEITGVYRYEARAEGAFHVWPVEWLEQKVPLSTLPGFERVLARTSVTEIRDEDLLGKLKARIPSLRRRGYKVFKWIAIVTLIGEMFYFWPR